MPGVAYTFLCKQRQLACWKDSAENYKNGSNVDSTNSADQTERMFSWPNLINVKKQLIIS